MSELITIARSYAKAVFDFAVEHQAVAHWRAMLTFCTEVSRNEQFTELLLGTVAPAKLAKTFIAICGEELDADCCNLIWVMAENNRLNILPDVLEQFIFLCTAQEGVVKVDLISTNTLKKEQLLKISAAMERRLSRKIKLNCKVDKSIVAGVVIRVGDVVIDGSVRGRLERLADVLQS
ncbi:MAG: F0F1 ATP synthase subunit delta [Sodalis sp. (in: enterobacteria)]